VSERIRTIAYCKVSEQSGCKLINFMCTGLLNGTMSLEEDADSKSGAAGLVGEGHTHSAENPDITAHTAGSSAFRGSPTTTGAVHRRRSLGMHGLPGHYVQEIAASLCASTDASVEGEGGVAPELPTAKAILHEVLGRFLAVRTCSLNTKAEHVIVLQVTYNSDEASQKSAASHCWGLDGLLADLCLEVRKENSGTSAQIDTSAKDEAPMDAGGERVLEAADTDTEGADTEGWAEKSGQSVGQREQRQREKNALEATHELTPPESFGRLVESAKNVSDVVEAVLRLQVFK
jgi:hypothetical protein